MVKWVRPVGQVADDRCSDHTVPYTLQNHEVLPTMVRARYSTSLDKGVLGTRFGSQPCVEKGPGACQFNMMSDGLLLQRNRWATLNFTPERPDGGLGGQLVQRKKKK